MIIPTTEWVFLVTAKIEVNDVHLITNTWSSSENFDDCYRKIDNYIRKMSKPEDKRYLHVLSTSEKEYPIDYD